MMAPHAGRPGPHMLDFWIDLIVIPFLLLLALAYRERRARVVGSIPAGRLEESRAGRIESNLA